MHIFRFSKPADYGTKVTLKLPCYGLGNPDVRLSPKKGPITVAVRMGTWVLKQFVDTEQLGITATESSASSKVSPRR